MSRPLKSLTIRIDGASRGNPGPAGAGVLFQDTKGKKLKELSVYLGVATNNVAESMALILGLQEAIRYPVRSVTVYADSELLVRQIRGEYRVRDRELQWLHVLLKHLIRGLESFEIRHVPRGQNRLADRLANRAVVEGLKKNPLSHPKPVVPAAILTQRTFW